MRYSIAAFACLVALTGCGKDTTKPVTSPAPSSAASTGAPVALSGTVNDHGRGDATTGKLDLEMDDFYFGPTYVKATPGATVSVQLENEGNAPHTFTIDAAKVDVQVDAGKDGTATFTMPASGALAFYCKFHKGQGMQGAFYGKEGDAVSGGTSSGDDSGAYGQ